MAASRVGRVRASGRGWGDPQRRRPLPGCWRGAVQAPLVIDVRQPYEFGAGHLPGSPTSGRASCPWSSTVAARPEVAPSAPAAIARVSRRQCFGPAGSGCRGGRRRHPGLEAHGYPSIRRRDGRSRLARRAPRPPARPTPRTAPLRAPPQPTLDPEQAQRGDPEQDRRRGRPPARPPPRPARCPCGRSVGPISRRSLTSRTMNTSTIGSSRPWRFCDAMITGSRSRPGISTISAPTASTNV